MEGKRLRSGKVCGAQVAANKSAALEACAFATLPPELFTRILELALKDDAANRASCKLVCKEWRDHVRSAATRLVIGFAGKYTQLGKALQDNSHIADLEVQVRNGHPLNIVSTRKYNVLSSRAWSNVVLRTDLAFQQGPASLRAFLAASHESLTSLTLWNVAFGVVDFAQALMGSAGLRKLVLERGCLNAPAFLALLESLTPMTGLKELYLDALFNDHDDGPREVVNNHSLAMLPSSFPNLEILSFHTYSFSGFSDKAYVSLLSQLLCLTVLRVRLYHARDLVNIPAIAAQHCPLLKELDLSARGQSGGLNRLGSPTFASGLMAVLERCSSLTTLKLPGMEVDLEGWPILLKKMGSIELLECHLSTRDASLLGTLVKLRHLTLTNYWEDLESVARVVKHLPRFSQLNILGQTLHPQQARSLKALLPGIILEYRKHQRKRLFAHFGFR